MCTGFLLRWGLVPTRASFFRVRSELGSCFKDGVAVRPRVPVHHSFSFLRSHIILACIWRAPAICLSQAPKLPHLVVGKFSPEPPQTTHCADSISRHWLRTGGPELCWLLNPGAPACRCPLLEQCACLSLFLVEKQNANEDKCTFPQPRNQPDGS